MVKIILTFVKIVFTLYRQFDGQMAKTNIKKKRKTISVSESLTQQEQELLKKLTTGYRTMVTAAEKATVHRHTLYAAVNGLKVKQDTLAKIRSFLKPYMESEPMSA